MEKKETWIYDKDGNLKEINCYSRKDKYGNEKKTYKESLTTEAIFVIVSFVICCFGGFAFWNSFLEFFKG